MHNSPSVSVSQPGWPQVFNMAIAGTYARDGRPGTSGSGLDGQMCGNSEISASAAGGQDVAPGPPSGRNPRLAREAPGRPDLRVQRRDSGKAVDPSKGTRAD